MTPGHEPRKRFFLDRSWTRWERFKVQIYTFSFKNWNLLVFKTAMSLMLDRGEGHQGGSKMGRAKRGRFQKWTKLKVGINNLAVCDSGSRGFRYTRASHLRIRRFLIDLSRRESSKSISRGDCHSSVLKLKMDFFWKKHEKTDFSNPVARRMGQHNSLKEKHTGKGTIYFHKAPQQTIVLKTHYLLWAFVEQTALLNLQ